MADKVDLRMEFAVPVFSSMMTGFKSRQSRLIEIVYEKKEKDQGVTRSNQGGWHSDQDFHLLEYPEVKWLNEKIRNIALTGLRHVKGTIQDVDVQLVACWANINQAGAWNSPHHHLPLDWSGVVYISVEQAKSDQPGFIREGDFILFDPLPMGNQFGRPGTVRYEPKDGKIMFFPSYMMHMVAPHYSETPRISLSFNLKLVERKRKEDPRRKIHSNRNEVPAALKKQKEET